MFEFLGGKCLMPRLPHATLGFRTLLYIISLPSFSLLYLSFLVWLVWQIEKKEEKTTRYDMPHYPKLVWHKRGVPPHPPIMREVWYMGRHPRRPTRRGPGPLPRGPRGAILSAYPQGLDPMPRSPAPPRAPARRPKANPSDGPFRYPEGHDQATEDRYLKWYNRPDKQWMVPVAVRSRLEGLSPSPLPPDPEATPEALWARSTGATAIEFLTQLYRGQIRDVDPASGEYRPTPIALRLEAAKLALAYHNRMMPPPVQRSKVDSTTSSASLTFDPKQLASCSDDQITAALDALKSLGIDASVAEPPPP